ncbi:hypothetical protein CPB86DRAFT_308419 [Serendipita vermifera]|nr:hypothetical protein CPB86DRAFT_308419 [Serendipita vermifera]
MGIFPHEIIQEILEYIRPPFFTRNADDAEACAPYDTCNWWTRYSVHLHGSLRQRAYIDILSLRLVNRAFNFICTAYVYQEISLHDPVDEVMRYIAKHYGQHVLMLRIFVTMKSSRGNMQAIQAGTLTAQCPRIRAISLYYQDPFQHRCIAGMPDWIILHIKQNKELESVGLYVLQDSSNLPILTTTVDKHVGIIASGVGTLIKSLHLSVSIVTETICGLLTNFPMLEHLSICGDLNGGEYDRLDWSTLRHLTILRLVTPSKVSHHAFSYSIPKLVQSCPSLQQMWISDNGLAQRDLNSSKLQGWSEREDEWWNQRRPLAFLHLECKAPTTLWCLGIIPVNNVSLILHDEARNHPGTLWNEIFPHMQTLKVRSRGKETGYWSNLCEERGISFSFEELIISM